MATRTGNVSHIHSIDNPSESDSEDSLASVIHFANKSFQASQKDELQQTIRVGAFLSDNSVSKSACGYKESIFESYTVIQYVSSEEALVHRKQKELSYLVENSRSRDLCQRLAVTQDKGILSEVLYNPENFNLFIALIKLLPDQIVYLQDLPDKNDSLFPINRVLNHLLTHRKCNSELVEDLLKDSFLLYKFNSYTESHDEYGLTCLLLKSYPKLMSNSASGKTLIVKLVSDPTQGKTQELEQFLHEINDVEFLFEVIRTAPKTALLIAETKLENLLITLIKRKDKETLLLIFFHSENYHTLRGVFNRLFVDKSLQDLISNPPEVAITTSVIDSEDQAYSAKEEHRNKASRDSLLVHLSELIDNNNQNELISILSEPKNIKELCVEILQRGDVGLYKKVLDALLYLSNLNENHSDNIFLDNAGLFIQEVNSWSPQLFFDSTYQLYERYGYLELLKVNTEFLSSIINFPSDQQCDREQCMARWKCVDKMLSHDIDIHSEQRLTTTTVISKSIPLNDINKLVGKTVEQYLGLFKSKLDDGCYQAYLNIVKLLLRKHAQQHQVRMASKFKNGDPFRVWIFSKDLKVFISSFGLRNYHVTNNAKARSCTLSLADVEYLHSKFIDFISLLIDEEIKDSEHNTISEQSADTLLYLLNKELIDGARFYNLENVHQKGAISLETADILLAIKPYSLITMLKGKNYKFAKKEYKDGDDRKLLLEILSHFNLVAEESDVNTQVTHLLLEHPAESVPDKTVASGINGVAEKSEAIDTLSVNPKPSIPIVEPPIVAAIKGGEQHKVEEYMKDNESFQQLCNSLIVAQDSKLLQQFVALCPDLLCSDEVVNESGYSVLEFLLKNNWVNALKVALECKSFVKVLNESKDIRERIIQELLTYDPTNQATHEQWSDKVAFVFLLLGEQMPGSELDINDFSSLSNQKYNVHTHNFFLYRLTESMANIVGVNQYTELHGLCNCLMKKLLLKRVEAVKKATKINRSISSINMKRIYSMLTCRMSIGLRDDSPHVKRFKESILLIVAHVIEFERDNEITSDEDFMEIIHKELSPFFTSDNKCHSKTRVNAMVVDEASSFVHFIYQRGIQINFTHRGKALTVNSYTEQAIEMLKSLGLYDV